MNWITRNNFTAKRKYNAINVNSDVNKRNQIQEEVSNNLGQEHLYKVTSMLHYIICFRG